MKLFVSYARVDKNYCDQIIGLLDIHDVWHDQRLRVGQKWWDEIVRRLHWCEGYIYLLSSDSASSDYCHREYEIAMSLNKPIFPVLIQRGAVIPEELCSVPCIDLSEQLNVHGVKTLLTALWRVEREIVANPPLMPSMPTPPPPAPEISGAALLDEAVRAFERCDYDKAVFLLKKVQESLYTPRFISVDAMLRQAEAGLERQAYLRDAQREYAPIARMMRNETSRSLGCTSFRAFQASFPDYDPENLAEIYEQTIHARPPFILEKAMPMLEWCRIPTGKVMIERNHSKKTFDVPTFEISKYPVTNAQFQSFIDAPDGYKNPAWWQSSPEVQRWHVEHATPIAAAANRENHPRAFVCWHEASAFCQWLSFKTGQTIKLPTEQQWQRAAQGDTNNSYPWGTRFNKTLCNSKESALRKTTPVTQYAESASVYGVYDLLGNVWEWCANGHAVGDITDVSVDIQRVVRGGSFMSSKRQTNINFFYYLNPLYRYQSIGFRIAREVERRSK